MTLERAVALKTAVRRPALQTSDLVVYLGAALATIVAAFASVAIGADLGLGLVLIVAFFAACLLGFLVAPHVVVALMIPLFAFIPAAKVFLTPLVGPAKDLVTLAAAAATVAVLVLKPARSRVRALPDRWVLLGVGLLLALYVLNVGGGHGAAWAQGLRLTSEPLLLLIAGLTLADGKRTLRWAIASLVATACAVACYGLLQQAVGQWTLVGWGYSFSKQVRTYNGHLRSFSTFDDPFAYAAFLLFGLAAVFFWLRRGVLAAACAALIVSGLAVSYVRTAALIVTALVGLWLARKGLSTSSVLVTAAAVVAMGSLLVTGAGATETRTYSSDTSNLTFNGRISAWKAALGSPSQWPFGRGVGKVGTAAYRSAFVLAPGPKTAPTVRAVDSGYLATIADVGLAGVAVLLALLARLVVLAWRGTRRGQPSSWLALGLIAVLVLDAATRSSFTGFPTAFLGLFIVGLALSTAANEKAHDLTGAPASRSSTLRAVFRHE
jgi:O-antigen ligase